jgi:ATP-binding cassette subfamily B protein
MRNRYPFRKQTTSFDCGPTCLQMIAEYYGRKINSDTLIKLSSVNETGTSLFNLAKAAEAIGFSVLPISIPFHKLGDIKPLPCIAHYRKDHFVVIYEVGENTITYADPAFGLLTKPKSQFLKAWLKPGEADAGYVVVLEPSKAKKNPFIELLGHLLPHKKHLLYAILLLAVGSGLQLLFPLLTQHIVDGAISNQNIELLYLLLIGQVMITIGRVTSDIVRRRILLALTSNVNTSISLKLLTKLTKLPLKYFDTKKMSDLRQRVSDIESIEKFVSGASLTFAFSIINVLVYSFLLVSYNLSIYLIVIGSCIIHLVFVTVSMKKLKALNIARFNARSDSDSKLTHIVGGIADIKLNNYERKVLSDWKANRKNTFKVSLDTIKANQKQETGTTLIMELSNVVCIFIAAKAVIGGEMTLGTMIALQYMIGQLRAPVLESVNFFRAAQEANLSFERVNEILDLPEENSEDNNVIIPGDREDITISEVNFKYPGADDRSALHDISVTIPAGRVTAIVGTSGSGKSTLMKLLLQIYEPSSGEIRIGTNRFDEINTNEWRKRAAIVLQEGYIFPGTVAENIALSSESKYDPGRLANAIKIANISDLVARLPQGINTMVRNENFSFSKGERQRVLIARAIYRDPEYLFLDEATASLDSDNENIILNNIINHFHSRTVVIITHRVSMITNASQIIVMQDGRVVDAGIHAELIERQPAYIRLHDSQTLYENI